MNVCVDETEPLLIIRDRFYKQIPESESERKYILVMKSEKLEENVL